MACDGGGEVGSKRCGSCLGAKKLKVVIPGPNHPVKIRGTVRDLSVFESLDEAQNEAAKDAASKKLSLKAVKGAIREATISISGPDASMVLESKSTGRFKSLLKPQEYRVTIEAEGYTSKTITIVVPPRIHPVWPKLPGGKALGEDETYQMDIFLEP